MEKNKISKEIDNLSEKYWQEFINWAEIKTGTPLYTSLRVAWMNGFVCGLNTSAQTITSEIKKEEIHE